QWNAFCRRVHPGISMPCGNTEFYPQFGNAKAENGSNNVMTYITSSFGNGSIGYDEYAYALNSHYPVVKVLNPDYSLAGPSASNVSVALPQAITNEDQRSRNFLQQDLHKLYRFRDPRNYPISSYSYLIVPRSGTTLPTNFTTAKGRTLSTFVNFMLCGGQQQMQQLGYSPLPRNLVQRGLVQNAKIPGNVSLRFSQLRNCHNPTMQNGHNILLATAPFPSPCQKRGAPLHCVVKNGKAVATGSSASGGGAGKKGSSSAGLPATSTAGKDIGTGNATGATRPVTGAGGDRAGAGRIRTGTRGGGEPGRGPSQPGRARRADGARDRPGGRPATGPGGLAAPPPRAGPWLTPSWPDRGPRPDRSPRPGQKPAGPAPPPPPPPPPRPQ